MDTSPTGLSLTGQFAYYLDIFVRRPPTNCWCLPTGGPRSDGGRSRSLALARVWNDLLSDVTSAPSLAVFGRRLKTELFRRCYNAAGLFLTLIVVLEMDLLFRHSKYYVWWWWWWWWWCRLQANFLFHCVYRLRSGELKSFRSTSDHSSVCMKCLLIFHIII